MLSGATLMDYRDRYTTKEFLRRRARRTLVPFLAWSVIALVWKVGTGQKPLPQGPMALISLIFNTQIIDIYWFFIPLFAVYLSLPVLSLLRDNKKALRYLATLGVLLNVALSFLCSVAGITWNSSASFPLLGGYLLYVLLGYLLRDAELDSSKRRLIYIVGIAGVLVRFVHTVLASRASGELLQLTWGYTNLPCFLEAMAVFVFARQVKWDRFFRSDRSREALSRVAGCSFGVYLIHMIVFWFGLVLSEYDGGDYATQRSNCRLCGLADNRGSHEARARCAGPLPVSVRFGRISTMRIMTDGFVGRIIYAALLHRDPRIQERALSCGMP